MYSIKSKAVSTAPKEFENLQDDLIQEINQFYIEVTGNSMNESALQELYSMHIDDLRAKLNGLKMSEAYDYLPSEETPFY